MKITALDRAIFLLTLFGSIAAMLLSGFVIGSRGGTAQVVIEVNGAVYGRYPLEPHVLEIRNQYGYNRIEIMRSGVYITDSDCPDRREVSEGMISRSGQALICLPHRLVVRISQEGGEADVSTY